MNEKRKVSIDLFLDDETKEFTSMIRVDGVEVTLDQYIHFTEAFESRLTYILEEILEIVD